MDRIEREILSLYGKSFLYRLFIRLKLSLVNFREFAYILPPEGKIYELGSGYGLFSIYLALEEPKRSILGIEVNHNHVSVARNLTQDISNLKFVCSDVVKENLSNCDGIAMISLLHHLTYSEQEKLTRKCYESLNQKGVLVILDPVNHPLLKYFINWLSDWVLYPFQNKTFFRSRDGIMELLSSSGFHVTGRMERKSGWGLFSYALVIGRKLTT